MATRNGKHRRLWLSLTAVAVVPSFYIVTVGLAEAISGNIQTGRVLVQPTAATLAIFRPWPNVGFSVFGDHAVGGGR